MLKTFYIGLYDVATLSGNLFGIVILT